MTTATREPVAGAVRVLAAWHGVSLPTVAADLGFSVRTWRRRLAEGDWSVQEVRQLADYFGVPPAALLDGPDKLFREEVATTTFPRARSVGDFRRTNGRYAPDSYRDAPIILACA